MSKAFTMLELIIVMSIVATLMGIGITALIKYRSNVQLQSAYTETLSDIKILQNKANNSSSVVVGGVNIGPDIYALNLQNNIIDPYYCIIPPGDTKAHCDKYPSSGIVSFQSAYNVNVTTTGNCTSVGFIRLSSNVVAIDRNAFDPLGTGVIIKTGICTLTLTQMDTMDQKTINFNFDKNSIDLP